MSSSGIASISNSPGSERGAGEVAVWRGVVSLGLVVCAAWVGPSVWFGSKADSVRRVAWEPGGGPPGWNIRSEPVTEEIQSNLGAGVQFNGTLSPKDQKVGMIRAFLAVQDKDSARGSSFFSHTPDRCWPVAGWKLEPALPEWKKLTIGGNEFVFERRIFANERARELVYFGTIVGGHPYQGRMDHYLSYAERASGGTKVLDGGRLVPRLEGRALAWIGSVVRSRTRLDGAAQFLRLSTPLNGRSVEEADRQLSGMLQDWPRVREDQ